MNTLQAQIDQIGQQYDQATGQLPAGRGRLAAVRRQADRAQGQFSVVRAKLARVAVGAYENSARTSAAGLLTSADPAVILGQASLMQEMARPPAVSRGSAGPKRIGELRMSRPLRAGDRVRVRSAREMLSTLGPQSRLDGLPLMPEMLEFCGREFTVYRRADKVCDTVNGDGTLRRMRDTVHLAGVRCSGSAHGGCEAACLVHWKEAWLEPAGPAVRRGTRHAGSGPGPAAAIATVEALEEATTKPPELDGPIRYSCQATEMLGASEPMSKYSVTQYLRDIRSRNATIREVAATVISEFVKHYQIWSRKNLPKWMLIRGGRTLYDLGGMLTTTPRDQLHLQPGERIRVKSREEIAATLDIRQRNRGLSFFGGMIDDCGSEARVRSQVSRIIDEGSGRMLELTNDCVTLEEKVCHDRLCPRGSYKMWREVWLTRVDGERAT